MHERFLQQAIDMAADNVMSGRGGPYGAIIVKECQLIAASGNNVTSTLDPTAHAEIVAIRQASKNINSYNLSGSVIYSTCEPCPMCFSAVYWANIREVVFSLSRYDAEQMGFKDNHIYNEININHDERNIRFIKFDHPAVKDLMEEWNRKTDKFQY